MKISIPSKLMLRSLLYNKRFTISLSIILSFIIWLVVMINQNPIREHTFNEVSATVSIENTVASEMGLGIVSDVSNQKFTVTVSGPNYIVSSLKADDFSIYADITNVNSAGTYTLNIMGSRNSRKSGYTFTSISPATIDVTFDYIDTKEFTVVPRLVGVSAAEGLIAETPVASTTDQSSITIKGPRSLMNRISSVIAYAEVNKTLTSTQTFASDIILYDEKDSIIYRYNSDGKIYDESGAVVSTSYLSLSNTSVNITQPISKKRTVNVAVSFTNMPSGFTIGDISYSIDHTTVTIIGTPDVVDNTSTLTLSAIDFRSISKTSNKFEISPTLPDGVKLLDTIDYFTVSVDTSNYQEAVFNVTDIRVQGVASGLTAKTAYSVKNVKICGPKDLISKIRASDLYATVDLTDKSAGDHTVEAVIKCSKYNNVWQVGTYSTSVTIK